MISPDVPGPLTLVGWWGVSGTGQVVAFDPVRLEIHDERAVTEGTWRGDADGRFLATFTSIVPAAGNPGSAPTRPPAWLDAATSFVVEGVDRIRLDGATEEVARLHRVQPRSSTGWADPGRAPTPQQLRRAGRAAPVPSDLTAATVDGLVGHWRPAGFDGDVEPWATLGRDGTWTGTDGRNRVSGSWLAGDGGGLLATASAARTLIGGTGVDVGKQLTAASRAAFDTDGTLVLLDGAGEVVGRFTRA